MFPSKVTLLRKSRDHTDHGSGNQAQRNVVGNPGSHSSWSMGVGGDLRPRESKEGGRGKEEGQVEKVGQEGWGEIPHRQELHEGRNQAWIMSPQPGKQLAHSEHSMDIVD